MAVDDDDAGRTGISSATGTSTMPSDNPYLARRAAKIARNHARLEELGLVNFRPSKPAAKPPSKSQQSRREPNADGSSQNGNDPLVPTRRSERKRKCPVSYAGKVATASSRPKLIKQSKEPITSIGSLPLTVEQLKQLDKDWKLKAATTPPLNHYASGTKNSAREINLNVPRLLFGTSSPFNGCDAGAVDVGYLGRTMAQTGKAHVMQECARYRLVSSSSLSNVVPINSSNEPPISFNKYSGVQEWGNDVLFLWINLNGPQSDVTNEFPHQGRHVTWYGGSNMHDQTKVIGQLVRVGMHVAEAKTSANRNESSGDSKVHDPAIILWCRQYDSSVKAFGPYVCLGRLSVRASDCCCIAVCSLDSSHASFCHYYWHSLYLTIQSHDH
jgi:hypothetical protein